VSPKFADKIRRRYPRVDRALLFALRFVCGLSGSSGNCRAGRCVRRSRCRRFVRRLSAPI